MYKGFSRKRSVCMTVFVIAVIITLIAAMFFPSTVSAAEKTSDGNTTGSYAQNLGDNSSTRYAGRVWTDKTVYTEGATFSGDFGNVTIQNDSDFLVAYSALATSESVTGKSQVPVDVVFVIDNSGSMDYEYGVGFSTTSLEQTVGAVNQSIETIMESNPNSRVAVVAYDGAQGNTPAAQVLLPLDHYTKTGNTYIQNELGLNSSAALTDLKRMIQPTVIDKRP